MDGGPVGTAWQGAACTMKRTFTVDAFLRWAWRDELPKDQPARAFLRPASFGTPWGAVTKVGLQGMEIQEPDIRNRYGLVPDLTATLEPHPDAIAAWLAVEVLGDVPLDIPPDWYPLSDLGDLAHYGPAAVTRALDRLCFKTAKGARRLRRSAADLVRKHAVLGGAPEWKAEKPTFCTVNATNGRPRWFRRQVVAFAAGAVEVEVDGFDPKRRMPYPDAYLKHYYDPDPADAAEARAEYEIWRSAIDEIFADLNGRLEETTLKPCELPVQPWDEPERREPRIFVTKSAA